MQETEWDQLADKVTRDKLPRSKRRLHGDIIVKFKDTGMFDTAPKSEGIRHPEKRMKEDSALG